MEIKNKEIFLDELPKKYGVGANKDKLVIDWGNSVGCIINFIYDDIKDCFKIINCYKNNNRILLEVSYKNNTYTISNNSIIRCSLGAILNKQTSKFKVEIGQTFKDEKRDITIIDRKSSKDKKGYNRKYYKYKCNKCGFDCGEHYDLKTHTYKNELWIEESNLLSAKKGCSCCCYPTQIIINGINDIPTTDPWMVKYFQGGYEEAKKYTRCTTQKIYPICPDCYKIREKAVSIDKICIRHGIGCNCRDGNSRISKYMFNVLEQLKNNGQIDGFETEKTYNWCIYYNPYKNKESTGRYDFYISNTNILIETDGGFHRIDNRMSGQTKEESKFIDKEKDELAIKNGYKVIRITDEGSFKENILNSPLNDLYNLSIINWDIASEYSSSNLIKIACNYKKCNQNLSTIEIGRMMNYNYSTIRNWLKIGTEYGWCNYDPIEEIHNKNKHKLKEGVEKNSA